MSQLKRLCTKKNFVMEYDITCRILTKSISMSSNISQLKRLRKLGSQEISLIKKNKVTSQITTPSLSKKNNKKYYQRHKARNHIKPWSFNKNKTVCSHHDDDDDNNNDLYAKDIMIIDHVNDDCLAEIFMYVPTCERPKIALVCKKWKRALDNAWFNVKKLEFTYWRYDEYPNFLKKNYPTVDGQFNFLRSLLYKCGRYLRELDLSVYPKCNILPVINEYCPNLEELRIRIDYIDDIDRTIFNNAFTHLSKLKVLKIIFDGCLSGEDSLVPTSLINSLLNVADTLIDLNISKWSESISDSAVYPEEITSVITRLNVLRQFVTAGIKYSKSLSDYLNNSQTITTFSNNSCYISHRIDIKELFERIEVLNIISWPIPDDGLCNIANTMKRLHSLHVSCQWLTAAAIVTCTKIKNLKYINFLGYNNVTDSSIKLLKNLTHLKVPFSNKITDESIIKVLENSPEMQSLSLMNTSITHKFIEKAAEISRNRKKQLKIWVTLECDMSKTQVKYEYLTVFNAKNQNQQNENYITSIH